MGTFLLTQSDPIHQLLYPIKSIKYLILNRTRKQSATNYSNAGLIVKRSSIIILKETAPTVLQ